MKRKEGLDLPANYNPLLGIRNNLSFRNLTFNIAEEVRAIQTKYSILSYILL